MKNSFKIQKLFMFSIFIGLFQASWAQNLPDSGFYNGLTGENSSLEQALVNIHPGDILVIGENHGLYTHQASQLEIMQKLRNQGHIISVGMEFLYYPDQNLVNQYRSGNLHESKFLELIQWGSPSFDFYREQILFPNETESESTSGSTIALNAPRTLTGKVAKQGMKALNESELKLLPPEFTLGNSYYYERFKEIMGNHVPAQKLQNYFEAQSIWDDTMAWQTLNYIQNHPEQTFVIIVGEFHIQYGGGLPERIKSRLKSEKKIHTISLVNFAGLQPEERLLEIKAHEKYGPRADWVWTNVEQ